MLDPLHGRDILRRDLFVAFTRRRRGPERTPPPRPAVAGDSITRGPHPLNANSDRNGRHRRPPGARVLRASEKHRGNDRSDDWTDARPLRHRHWLHETLGRGYRADRVGKTPLSSFPRRRESSSVSCHRNSADFWIPAFARIAVNVENEINSGAGI